MRNCIPFEFVFGFDFGFGFGLAWNGFRLDSINCLASAPVVQ
jgi:hypothetical protein